MRAIIIEQYGGPEVLQHRDIAIPQPRPGEVLVQVACAGINFMDIHTRQGKYADSRSYPVRLPCTLGMEGAGRVVALGPDVGRVAVGDRVAWCIAWGSYAEYACIPAARLARLPDDISFELAAAAMFQGCTAHYLVADVARLQAGSTCLIHAASGSIGQLLIQMAKRRGARVFATASTQQKCAIAAARGADHTMLYGDGAFADVVRSATGGRGVDVVFDSLGKATLRDSMRATRVRGLIVNYGNVSGSVKDLDPMELGEAGSLFLTRPRLADHMSDAATVQHRADAVFAALRDGALAIDIAGRYKLDNVHEAHARIEQREQIGKAVVWIDPAT
jgi:NADPH:quinone reductase-like Zn-dependent oxidoreductase